MKKTERQIGESVKFDGKSIDAKKSKNMVDSRHKRSTD
jgi:hypothetical protein